MSYQSVIIGLIVFSILVLIAAYWLASKVEVLEKELEKERANKRFVMPIATIKAEFSEEDMKKIKELLNNMKPGDVKLGEPDERKCECDHHYDSVILIDDPIFCREKLVFHCGQCGHEEIIPIRRGLLTDMIRQGGRA